MKKITIILLGFIALLAVSCDKDDHLAPDKSKYVYDIPTDGFTCGCDSRCLLYQYKLPLPAG